MEERGNEPDRVRDGRIGKPDIEEAFRDGTAIDRALREAVLEALQMHKRRGNPVAVGRDGVVEWIPAEKISLQNW